MTRDLIFAGREAELESALALLEQVGQICITGQPGVGKSAFLRELLHRHGAAGADGIWTAYIENAEPLDRWEAFEEALLGRLRGPAAMLPVAGERAEAFFDRLKAWWRAEGPTDMAPLVVLGLDRASVGKGGGWAAVVSQLEDALTPRRIKLKCILVCDHLKPGQASGIHWRGRTLMEFSLKGPTTDDVSAFGEQLGLDPEAMRRLMEGPPQNWSEVHRRVESMNGARSGDYWTQRAEELLQSFGEAERERVLRGSLLDDLAGDTLSIFYPPEQVESLLHWFRTHFGRHLSPDGPRLRFEESVAVAMRRLYNREAAPRYREDLRRAEKVNALVEKEGEAAGRRLLLQFLVFHFFNPDLVRAICPVAADDMCDYLERRGDLFLCGEGGNWRMRPDVRACVRDYAALLQVKIDPAQQNAIRERWDEKRIRLETNIEQAKVLLENHGRELERVRREMRKIRRRRATRSPFGPGGVFREARGGRILAGVALQAVGISLVYLDLALNEDISLGNLAAGSAFVMLGVFHFRPKATDRRRGERASEAPPLPPNLSGQIQLMRQRAAQIESHIQRTRQQIQMQERILKEPYIFTSPQSN